MLLPLDVVLRRGVIFLWIKYARLDDPALVGQTKPKFIVILSGSPQDDPLNDAHIEELMKKIAASRRVPRRIKQILSGN